MASEGEAKRAWLARQDAPPAWDQGGAVPAAGAPAAAAAGAAGGGGATAYAAPVAAPSGAAPDVVASEQAAKAAWLAKRDQTGYSRDTQRRLGL